MKKKSKKDNNDDIRSEYDLRELFKNGARGKFAEQYKAGTNIVLLDPDVAEAFENAKADS